MEPLETLLLGIQMVVIPFSVVLLLQVVEPQVMLLELVVMAGLAAVEAGAVRLARLQHTPMEEPETALLCLRAKVTMVVKVQIWGAAEVVLVQQDLLYHLNHLQLEQMEAPEQRHQYQALP